MRATSVTTKKTYRGKTLFMEAPAYGKDGLASRELENATALVGWCQRPPPSGPDALGTLDRGYTDSYTQPMKTAISIPDNLFKAADKVARRMGISRSELYQRAIERYLQQQSGDVIREALDVVYSKASNRDIDPLIKAAGEHVFKDENW